jgi:hypothetical protein
MISFNELLLLFEQLYRKRQHGYVSVAELTNIYCPYARGLNNGGLIVPDPQIIGGNASTTEWSTLMSFYPVHHLEYWLKRVHEYPPDTLITDLIRDCGMGCQQHILPSVYYVKYPEQVTIRCVTMIELANLLNFPTVTEFAVYLYCIVIMGIFINDAYATEVYQLTDPNAFVAARLFQGELDYMMTGGIGITSAFQSLAVQDGSFYDSQPFYQSISGNISPEEFNQLVQQQRSLIENSTYLGNEVPQVIAMKKALALPESYSNYLEHRGDRFTKVGQKVFDGITLGRSTRKELSFSQPVNIEKAAPIAAIQSRAANLTSWEKQELQALWSASSGGVNKLWGFTNPGVGQGGQTNFKQANNSF